MRSYSWPGFLGILLGGMLLLLAPDQVSGQQRGLPSTDEQLRQAESQLLRITGEHRQAEEAASNRWKWIAGGAIAAGLMLGTVVVVRRLRASRRERTGKVSP